jgi:hypothetical protein
MRMRIARALFLATSLLVVGASLALAAVDVNLAFDPNAAAPGQQVTLTASIANLATEAVAADFTVTVSYANFTTGAQHFVVQLPASYARNAVVPFVVPALPVIPQLPASGILDVTITAAAGQEQDTAHATLTILPGPPPTALPNWTSLAHLGTALGTALTGPTGTLAASPATLSDVKRLYR